MAKGHRSQIKKERNIATQEKRPHATAKYVGIPAPKAKYAVNKMFDGKTVIIPGASMKANRILTKVLPQNIILEITSRIQHRRIK